MKSIVLMFFVLVMASANSTDQTKKYHVFTLVKLNWYEAFMDCLSRDLQLATVNSADEQLLIEQAMKDAGATTELLWLSGTDHAQEGKFRWMSTGKAVSYGNWLKGQPDNAGQNENCLHIWNPQGFGIWNDSNCLNKWFYICEDKTLPRIKVDVNMDVHVN